MAKDNLVKRGETYYARLWVHGREVRRSLRTRNRSKALERLGEIREQAERALLGLGPKESPKRWGDAVLRFTDLHLPGLRESTAARYRVSLRQLNVALRGVLLAEVTQGRLSAYAASRMKEGASPATVRRDLNTASLVLHVAKRAGWVTGNPAREEMSAIKERRETIRPVRIRDLALTRMLAKRDGKVMAYALFGFLVRMGCRLEEAASLEWEDVRLDDEQPVVTFVKTKTRSPRTIDLPPSVVRELRRLPRPAKGDFIFHRGQGDRYAKPDDLLSVLVTRSQAQDGWRAKAARPFRIHDLRHTHAIRQLSWPLVRGRKKPPVWCRRMSIFDLAMRLGHKQVSTTEGYAKWLRERPDEWMRNPGTAQGPDQEHGRRRD